jgi:DNA-binding response OmpR family regulator
VEKLLGAAPPERARAEVVKRRVGTEIALVAVMADSLDALRAAGPVRPRRPPDVAGLRVVLAEDDATMRHLVALALRRDGFEVLEVADGHALAKVADAVAADELEISVVISDIRMPGKSGLSALPILQKATTAPPVLLITAFGDAATHEAAERLGAAGVMDKPFEIDDLRTVVWYLALGAQSRTRAKAAAERAR